RPRAASPRRPPGRAGWSRASSHPQAKVAIVYEERQGLAEDGPQGEIVPEAHRDAPGPVRRGGVPEVSGGRVLGLLRVSEGQAIPRGLLQPHHGLAYGPEARGAKDPRRLPRRQRASQLPPKLPQGPAEGPRLAVEALVVLRGPRPLHDRLGVLLAPADAPV